MWLWKQLAYLTNALPVGSQLGRAQILFTDVFYCSRFARAGGANMFQVLLQCFLSAFVRTDTLWSWTTFNFFAHAGKATAMESGL